ncbi:MAG TPA: helix-turn-helix transcriptional regulator [Micromonosporaceae bacterium]|nr:helix-turn-helix transcriptional regulator [Micromonosporaceae bacterium]
MSQERSSLSAREKEVVVHLSRGLTYLQIGRRLGIAVWTVDTYLRRVRAKTGATTSADLVRLGLRLQPPEADGQQDRPSA